MTVYEGVVTQAGTMMDGHVFLAKQAIRMAVRPVDGGVECEIVRTEVRKSVDGLSRASPRLPPYLNAYLSSFGSCKETVRGVLCEGLMCLEAIAPPQPLVRSDVLWSPHSYYLILAGDGLKGVAINRDVDDDRVNHVGRVRMWETA
jgi:hypothetical protein